MKTLAIAVVSILVCAAAVAQEHGHHHMSNEDWLKLLASMPHPAPAELATVPNATVTVNMTAKQFEFQPSNITVNQGDTLILNISVPIADESPEGHGLIMETYLPNGTSIIHKGSTTQVVISATQSGTFLFACNQSNCGTGHSNMFGMLTVNKVTNPAPTVAGITPSSGPTTGGTSVIIAGANFQNSSVTFGGVAAASVTVTSSTSIVAVTPPRASAGTVPVVVKNGDGQSVSFDSFTYTLPGPSITSVTPSSGPTSGGTTFTITGVGFVKGATVTVGGNGAGQVNVVDSTTITALSPRGPSNGESPIHTFDVVVRNPDGTTITKTGAFQYTFPPLAVSSIFPAASLPAGGVDVTITGVGFNSALATSATFGGVAATNVRVVDAVTMIATVPAHAAGTVDVVITDGTSVTVTNGFVYGNPPPRKRAAGH